MNERPWAGQPVVRDDPASVASYVSWDDAAEFCRRLSETDGAAYRLPTEAEWEYACRAGAAEMFGFDDPKTTFDAHVWHKGNAYDAGEQYPHAIGQTQPNRWALHDMHGNVWEWTGDWYAAYSEDAATDPTGPETGRRHVWRGGSFASPWNETRAAARMSSGRLDYQPPYLAGFRVVREWDGNGETAK